MDSIELHEVDIIDRCLEKLIGEHPLSVDIFSHKVGKSHDVALLRK